MRLVGGLRLNIGATFVGNMAYAASQWVLLVIIARSGNAEEVGLFALGLAITAPIFAFAGLDLEAIQATDASGEYWFADFLGLRCLLLPPAMLLSMVFALSLGGSAPGAGWVIAAVTVSKAVESLGLVAYGLYNKHELMHLTASSLLLRGWGGAVVFGLAYVVTGNLALSVVALALAWAAIIVAVDGRRVVRLQRSGTQARHGRSRIRPRVKAPVMKALLFLSLPAAVSTTVATLTVQAPRYALEIYVDTAALGIFASLAYLVRVIEMVSSAIGTAVMPRLAKYLAEGRPASFVSLLSRMLAAAVGLGVVGIVATILVGEPALRLLYGAEFAREDVLLRLMVASVFVMLAKLLGAALMSMRVLKMRMAVFVVTLMIVALASVILIPDRNIIGAAEALILGFVWRCLASGALVVYHLKKRETVAS